MRIIGSLLDLDFYKLTMGQAVFKLYPKVVVKYAFKNRTKKVRLGEHIREADLRAELDYVRTLRFTEEELDYLRKLRILGERVFAEDYLRFLGALRLPDYDLRLDRGEIVLEFPGLWSEAIYWETIALAIANELYYRSTTRKRGRLYGAGMVRLDAKIRVLREHPEITFLEFGTRRRFSGKWQHNVTETLASELPRQMIGTSNVLLAKQLEIAPKGTVAHEWFMVIAGIFGQYNDLLHFSHYQALDDWWHFYGAKLSIALTDTFGTRFFFESMDLKQAERWTGLRQDSGDPFVFGESAIKFYEKHGIDPREKLIVFSDGLDVDLVVKLHEHFKGRIKTTFGWGTNLTNDLGPEPLSLVIKAVEAEGRGLVKLSDNLAKATGRPEDVERYKRVFGYTNDSSSECRY
ncbi:MAG: nicotinate phosphoribosyltransferase [Candidatus Niyogibacteria bacterium]|nr:nicotinate phosphoribosyltransferase [Candidatus Niyogibacteria bacterium]